MKILTAALLLFLSLGLEARDHPVVPQTWDGISLHDFADSLHSRYGIYLFFRAEWFENRRVSVPEDGMGVQEVLSSFLSGTNYNLENSGSGRIYISPEPLLELQLPSGYFTTENKEEEVEDYRVDLEDVPEDAGVPEENKYLQVIDIGSAQEGRGKASAVISGMVTEMGSGEPIIGATVYSEDLQTGTVSNSSGYYFISLPKGTHRLAFRFVGKKEIYYTVNVYSDDKLNVEMEDKAMELKAVVVTSQKFDNVQSTRMGVSRLDTRAINSIPVIGEVDVLKVSMLLPGVQSVGEGTTGFNVRGGNTDQNLILIDKAPVFNPSHLMGFFSAFNAEIIRDFELYKSVVPASMGGRLSSVMDLNVKNGNKKKFAGSAGVSPLTGKFNLEGPVVKDKISFLVAGRSTYSNWILKRINNEEIRRSEASFYDLNAKLDVSLNPRHSLSISGYYSDDVFHKNLKDTSFEYTNQSLNLEWKYRINPALIMNNNLIYSGYFNSLTERAFPERAYAVKYNIDYYEYRNDFTYFLSNDHLLNFGLSGALYSLLPGSLDAVGSESDILTERIETEKGLDMALYISDEYKINSRLTMNAGLRYSFYAYLSPNSVFEYAEGLPLDISTLRDTSFYEGFGIIDSNHGPEPRVSLRYTLGANNSLKAGYSRMRQNVHIMSNTFSVSPTDTWKLSDPNISRQVADQVSLGYYQNLFSGRIETSVEMYYKKIDGLKDYKVAATLLMNEHVETELVDTEGRAYGVELLVRKPAGKLNGWLSYTYSRIEQKTDSEFRDEQINSNTWFPAVYDKPHSLSVVGSFRFNRRFSVSSNVVYSTGRPITYPVARYNFRNGQFLHYSERNKYRVEDYFRWDLSLNLDGNLRIDQIAHSFWSLSVYNITGRDNTYSIYFISGKESVQGYKMSIFAEPIISLSYNFRF